MTPEGDLIVSLEVGHLREVERFALSWGALCEVMEPPELRKRMAREFSRVAAYYPPIDPG
jgi:predicted DNA-binding transcriptional regulator YafY